MMKIPTILCVDDERNVLLTLRAQLQRCFPDYRIEIAESGEEALALVAELVAEGVSLPLVIADQIMPGMKGDQLLIELHRRYPQMVKVMLTGQASAADVGNVVNRGSLYRFLSKPWNETDLQLTVAEALYRYQQEQQLAQQQLALEQANQDLTTLNATLEQQVQERSQELRHSQQLLQLFAEHVPASVAMFDQEMRYLIISDRWKSDYGLGEQSLVGRSHYEVFPEIPDRWKAIHRRCLAGAVERCEEDCFVRADGTVTWVQWEIHPWYNDNGAVGGVIMFTQVITERKLAQETLRQSEARLASAERIAHLGSWEFDLVSQKITWSDEMFRIFGLDPAQGEPSYTAFQQQVHPDDRPVLQAAIDRAIADGTAYEVEHRIFRPDGSIRHILGRGEAVFNAKGLVIKLVGTGLDQTTTKLTELALRESEARLRRLSENLPGVVYRYTQHSDGSDCFLYMSARCQEIYGLSAEAALQNVGLVWATVHPDDVAQMRAEIALSVQHPDRIFYVEHRIITGAGQIKWVQVTSRAERQANGDVIWDGVVLDITARKQAELALQENQQFVEQIASSAPNVIYIYDLVQHRSLYVNKEVPTFLGYTEVEVRALADQPISRLMHPDDLEPAMQHFRHLATLPDGAIAEFEYRMRHKDNTWRWFFSRDLVFKRDADGRVVQILGNAQDITARKQTEIALQESERFLSMALSAAKAGVWERDLTTHQTYWSEENFRLLGYELGSAASYESWLQAVHPEDRERAQAMATAAVAVGTLNLEYRVLWPDGSVRWLVDLGELVRDAVGNPTRLSGIRIDITERKQAEFELQRRESQLAAVAANVPGGVFRILRRAEGSYTSLFTSEGYRNLCGFGPEQAQADPDILINLLHPDDREPHFAAWEAALETRSSTFHRESRYILPTGETKWIATRAQFHYQDNGDVIVDGLDLDVTDRKQFELDIIQAQELREVIFNESADALFLIDLETLLTTDCNARALELFEADRKEQLLNIDGQTLQRFSYVDAEVEQILKDLSTSDPWNRELEYQTLRGHLFWGSLAAKQICVAGRRFILARVTDISARKQLELQLRQREAFLDSIYNGVGVAISVIDVEPDGGFRYVDFNPLCSEWTLLSGLDTSLIRGKTLEELAPFTASAELEAVRTQLQHCATGQTIQFETALLNQGQQQWWLNQYAPLRDESGCVHRLVGTSILITERKRAEAQLAAQNSLLARIATGEPLSEILKAVIIQLEQQVSGAIGSVLLLDDTNRLRHGAAPHLPPDYVQAVDGVMVGDGVGSCGTAAFLKQPVIVSDIATDPLWESYRGFTTEHGLRACWSIPIIAADGQVLGTFGVYFAEVCSPQANQLDLISQMANLAGIAIERDRAEAKIRQSEEQLRRTLEFSGIGAWNWHAKTGEETWNGKMAELLELTPDMDNMLQIWRDRVHADDLAGVEASIQEALVAQRPFAAEYRYRLQDGRTVWRWTKGQGIYTETGHLERVLGVLQDITDRKQIEEALQASEAQYRRIVETANEGIWILDAENRTTFVNPKMAEMLGYGVEDMLGKSLFDFMDDAGVALAAQNLNRRQQGITEQHDFKFQHRQGAEIWAWISTNPILDDDGQYIGTLGMITDITERKQAEEALRQNEAQQRALISALPDLMMRISGDGVCLAFIAPSSFNAIGKTGDFVGEHVEDTLPPELAQKRLHAVRTALQTGELQIYEQEIWVNGILQTEECRAVVSGENEVLILGRDISERKRAERALKESETRFRQLAETVQEGFFVGEPFSLQFNYVNPAYETITGFSAAKLYADGTCWLDCIHPDDRERIDAGFDRDHQGQASDTEYRYCRPDGEERWLRSQVYPIRDAAGVPVRIVGTLEDITERKLAEQALQQLNEELELRVEQRTQALLNSQAELQIKEQLLRGIFEGSENSIFAVDVQPDGKFCYIGWNRATEEMTRISGVDALGRSPQELFGEELGSRLASNYRRCCELGEAISFEEHTFVDANEIWLATTLNPLKDTNGRIYRIVGNAVDITERKRAEKVLQQQLAAIEASNEGIAITTLQGEYTYLNSAHVRLFGYDHADELIGKTWKELYWPAEVAWIEQTVFPILIQQGFWHGETIARTKDDSPFAEELSLTLLPDGRIVCVCRDVSERRRAEQALQQSERDLRTIFNNVYDCIFIHDLDGTILDVNDRALEMHRTTRERLLAASIAELSPPNASVEQLVGLFERVQAGENVRFEWRCQRLGDQTNFESEVTLRMANLANRTVCIATVRDITDRKQAEAALAEKNTILQSVIESTPDVVYVKDAAGRYVIFNSGFVNFFGQSMEQLLEKTDAELLPAATAVRVAEDDRRVMVSGLPLSAEETIPNRDGGFVTYWTTKSPWYDAQGQVIGVIGLSQDVTERKQAEQALRKNEAMLAEAQAVAKLGSWEFDLVSQKISWTTALFQIFGLDPNQPEPTFAEFGEFYHPDDFAQLQQLMAQTILTGEPYKLTLRVPQPDGSLRYLEGTGQVEYDAQGEAIRLYGTAQDITERKQAEQALRESEERFRQLAESVSGVFWLTDLQPQILYVSPAFEPIWQRSAKEVFESYETFLATIHPDDRVRVSQEMSQRYLRNVDVEYRILRPSGEVRWIRDQTFHIHNEAGEVYRLAGLAEDITERKLTEAALQEARQFAQSIADQTPAALYIYDILEQRNCYSNRSITDLLGYTSAEIVAMGSEVMRRLVHPEDVDKLLQHQQALLTAADGEDLKLEYRMRHADGEWRWFYSRDGVFKRDAEGNVIQYIGAAQDITDRKRLEQDLRQINAELEQRVADRTQDLQHAMEAAQAANRAKTSFLANMSHELRTPLNAILGFSQLLNRDDSLTLDQQNQVGIINRSGEHLLNLINDILAVSKIEAGRITLTTTCFNLRELLQELEELFQLKAEVKQLTLTMQISPTVPDRLQADQGKLRQVLINLLGNAIKFTTQGSVTLRIWQAEGAPLAKTDLTSLTDSTNLTDSINSASSSVPLRELGGNDRILNLHFEVEDTGCGIDPSEQAIVFEPFGQTQSGRNSQEGTGLGLAISRQFVQLMGGELRFTSRSGHGSRFFFTIPVEAVPVDVTTSQTGTPRVIGLAADQPSYRLLVVEDNLENRQFLVQLLRSVGFEVEAAVNGQEAIGLWQSWQPHLIWMDMRMPVLDGYAATQRIRILEQHSDTGSTAQPTKILALTASAFEDERAAILAAGCNDFVFKPITEALLFEKLTEHLGVQYLYQDQAAAPTSTESDDWLTGQALQNLPAAWLAQLRFAARTADEDLILELIDQLPPQEANLADALRKLVHALQIEKLIELIQEAEVPSA